MKEKKNKTVSLDLLQSILNYLADRPHREVHGLITAIVDAANKTDEPKAPEPEA